MAETQEKLKAKVVPGAFDDAARRDYARQFNPKRDTTGGLGTPESCMHGANLFDVLVEGKTVGRYALKSAERANGVEVFIVGATGHLNGIGLIESLLPTIEKQCAFADCLTVNTKRRGLVKKLLNEDWTLDSFVLRKKLKK